MPAQELRRMFIVVWVIDVSLFSKHGEMFFLPSNLSVLTSAVIPKTVLLLITPQ